MVLHDQGTLAVGAVSSTTNYISPASVTGNAPKLQALGTSSAGDSAALLARFDATAGDAPQIVLAKSKGTTLADYTTTAANDLLGVVAGEGSDGTSFVRAGSIRFYVDGTVSTGVIPGRVEIWTNNASGTATKAVTVDSSQNTTLAGDLLLATGKTVKINGTKIGFEDLNTPTDVTTNNANTSYHGLLPKLSGDTSQFLNGNGAWANGGLVNSQVILKQTLGAATTAWTVTLPVACKNLRARLIILNPTGTNNDITLSVNGTNTGHMQQSYSNDGTTIGANEAVTPAMSSVPANSYADFSQEYSIIQGVETTVKYITGGKNSNTSLFTSVMVMRIAQSSDISTITFTGNQTNGIGSGSYIIVERVDADVSPVFGVVFAGTADKTVANTDSATSLIPTGTGSATLAANSYSVAK
jgi:hypothetical protein